MGRTAQAKMQPSPDIVRMQVKLRFLWCPRNLLWTSCVLEARNAGKVAFSAVPARPSVDIVCVEGAECR